MTVHPREPRHEQDGVVNWKLSGIQKVLRWASRRPRGGLRPDHLERDLAGAADPVALLGFRSTARGVALVDDQDAVEESRADRADEAFGVAFALGAGRHRRLRRRRR